MTEKEFALNSVEVGLKNLQYDLDHLLNIIKYENKDIAKLPKWTSIKIREMEISCNEISIACKSILYDVENNQKEKL